MIGPGLHRFREVIERALHDPGAGYYARTVRTIGRLGDFSTAATMGHSLSYACAGWLEAAMSGSGIKTAAEIGAGDGSLAEGILRDLGWRRRLGFDLRLVETSQGLEARQRDRLGRRVRWHGSMGEMLSACGGRCHILANELVDAFPPTVLEWQDGKWNELALEISADGRVRRILIPWAAPEVTLSALDPVAWPGERPADGQRIEVLDAFARWWREWLPGWKCGSLLWIDYGDRFPALYHRRLRGTLRGYFRHQRVEGPDVFRRLGKQDITCDVNFTDLRAWGEAAGLETMADETLGDFLDRFSARRIDDPAASEAPAEAFRVLWQRRGNGT